MAPVPVNVTELPEQIVWSEPALTVGNAFTITVIGVLKLSQPFTDVWLT